MITINIAYYKNVHTYLKLRQMYTLIWSWDNKLWMSYHWYLTQLKYIRDRPFNFQGGGYGFFYKKKYSDSQCCWKKYSDFGGGQNKNYNSRVVRKKILNETKNHNPPPCKLNGWSLNGKVLFLRYINWIGTTLL